MSRSTAAWFAGAGILAVVRWVLDYTDPSYYDAASLLDYSAVESQTLAMVATGIDLILLWRQTLPCGAVRSFFWSVELER